MATAKPVKPAAVPQIYTPVPQRSDRANFAERADKTLTSIPGMVDGFNLNLNYVAQAVDYMDEKNTSITQMWTEVNSAKTTVLDALAAIQAGPVVSVMGRSGVVTGLVEAAGQSLGNAAMSTAPLGAWADFSTASGAGSDWPTTWATASWTVFTFGTNLRRTQYATQVLSGGRQGWTFVRSLQDTTWGPWQRVFTANALIEASKVWNITTGAVTLDPADATIHLVGLSSNTTVTVPAPRAPGDQMTIRFAQNASYSVTFGSNVALRVGESLPAFSAGEWLTISLIADHNVTKWSAFIGGRHPQ